MKIKDRTTDRTTLKEGGGDGIGGRRQRRNWKTEAEMELADRGATIMAGGDSDGVRMESIEGLSEGDAKTSFRKRGKRGNTFNF